MRLSAWMLVAVLVVLATQQVSAVVTTLNAPANNSNVTINGVNLNVTVNGSGTLNARFYADNITTNTSYYNFSSTTLTASGLTSRGGTSTGWNDSNGSTYTIYGNCDDGFYWCNNMVNGSFPPSGQSVEYRWDFQVPNRYQKLSVTLTGNPAFCVFNDDGGGQQQGVGADGYVECLNQSSGTTWISLFSQTVGGCDAAGDALAGSGGGEYSLPADCIASSGVSARARLVSAVFTSGVNVLRIGTKGEIYGMSLSVKQPQNGDSFLLSEQGVSSGVSAVYSYSPIASQRGTTVKWFVAGFNETGHANYSLERLLNVVNIVPVMVSAEMLPSTVYWNSTVLGSCNATDVEGDTVQYNWTWLRNSVNVSSGQSGFFAQGLKVNVSNLSLNMSIGDTLAFKCVPVDSQNGTGTQMNASVTLQSYPPTPVSVRISPSNPIANMSLAGYFNATDADNASLSYNCRWQKNAVNDTSVNGSIVSGVETYISNYSGSVSMGDVFKFICRASDGFTNSSFIETTVTVSVFTANASITPSPPPSNGSDYNLTGQCQLTSPSVNKSFYWWWLKNGVINDSGHSNATTSNASVNVSVLAHPYVVGSNDSFVCLANDGLVNDTNNKTATVSIPNSPPVLTSVALNQSIIDGYSSLGGFCAATDIVNQDNLSFEYQWYKDGSATSFRTNTWCFQEFANVSSCANQSVANSSYFDQNNGTVFMNYTKPLRVFEAKWYVLHGTIAAYNVTIPTACLTQNPSVLQLRMTGVKHGAFEGSPWPMSFSFGECFNGSAWNTITTVQNSTVDTSCTTTGALSQSGRIWDGASGTGAVWNFPAFGFQIPLPGCVGSEMNGMLYEEGVWWSTLPVYNYSVGSVLVNLLPDSAISKNITTHETWLMSCRANDTSNGVSPFGNSSAALTNNPPNISNIFVTSVLSGNVTTGYNCTYTYTDRQSDSESGSAYLWYYNGNLTGITSRFLGVGNVTVGTLVCTVTPADGYSVGNATNSSVYTINDTTLPNVTGASYPSTGTNDAPINIDVVCTDNSGFLATGFPKVEWTDVNDIEQPNLTMSSIGNGTFRRSFTFGVVGTYTSFKFYCKDGSGNLAVLNGSHTLVISVPTVVVDVGGGGGGQSSIIIVKGVNNQTIFTVQTESGSETSVLYMYPSQVREQNYIIQSYVQDELVLNVGCEGDFCGSVVFSSDSVKLGGMQTALLTATLSMSKDAKYKEIFHYTVSIGDAQGRTAVVQNEVIVSKLAEWYSKFSPVVQKGDSGYWFTLGSYPMPKLILYLILVAVTVFIAWLAVPKGRKYHDLATIIYIGTGVLTLVIASLVY